MFIRLLKSWLHDGTNYQPDATLDLSDDATAKSLIETGIAEAHDDEKAKLRKQVEEQGEKLAIYEKIGKRRPPAAGGAPTEPADFVDDGKPHLVGKSVWQLHERRRRHRRLRKPL